MDRRQFDAWVKRLPSASPGELRRLASRRRVLRGVVGGAFVVTAGSIGSEETAAAGEGICSAGCGALCEPIPAQLQCNFKNVNCLCMRSTSGAAHCADLTSATCPPPGAPDDCQRDRDCAAQGLGDFCVATAGSPCCSNSATQAQVKICVRRCLNLTTAGRTRLASSLLAGVGGQL
jgi:hypothetical protein